MSNNTVTLQMHDMSIFTPTIKKLARRKIPGNIFSPEDVEQELACKLYIELPKFGHLPKLDALRCAKVILTNRYKDIVRSFMGSEVPTVPLDEDPLYQRHKDDIGWDKGYLVRSTKSRLGVDGAYVDSVVFATIDRLSVKFDTGEEIHNYEELLSLTYKWAMAQDDATFRFITEKISPSKAIEEKWELMRASYSRYRAYEEIPPFTLASMLGIKNLKVYKIFISLKKYLERNGYKINYKLE